MDPGKARIDEKQKSPQKDDGTHNTTPTSQGRPRSSRTLISSVSSSPTASLGVGNTTTGNLSASSETRQRSSSDKNESATVGNRPVGSKKESGQDKQQKKPERIEEVVPQLEQITKVLKDFTLQQQQQQITESAEKGNGNGQQRQQQEYERELRFQPPWDSKIGQLQQVVRTLFRHSTPFVENRGSVIVRCFPYKSSTYMCLVYNLIHATLGVGQQFGLHHSLSSIIPIMLHYDDNGLPNPIQHPPVPYGMPQFVQNVNWTDVVLLRMHFFNQEAALSFLQSFNRTVGSVFDRRQVRTPFCHPDLTQPERMLRHKLQQICLEKNAGNYGARPQMSGGGRQHSHNTYHNRNFNNNGERYFHNGIQIYKEYPNGQTEPVRWENYTEMQYLHVVVASLRKYATMFKQKESSVIIQNIDVAEESSDEERINALVYGVISTELYRQRCQLLQDRNYNRYNNDQHNDNYPNNPAANQSGGSVSSRFSSSANAFLPTHIERIPIKGKTTTENKTSSDAAQSPPSQQPKGRPPLVRIQFRNKEAAQAFCYVFKDFQQKEKDRQRNKQSKDADSEDSNNSSDSYSDLSDLEVFSEHDGNDNEELGKEERKQRKKHHKKPLCVYFPNAFVHRDLTPPELALGYTLRQFCRKENAKSDDAGPSTSAANDNSNGSMPWKRNRYYTRAGRIFVRSAVPSANYQAATSAN